MRRAFLLTSGLVGLVVSAGPAGAAVPGCTAGATPRETVICSDPALSGLDARIRQSFREKTALLSPEGADRLRRSQDDWLRFVDAVCLVGPELSEKRGSTPAECFLEAYSDRLDELATVARIGPFTFNRIDLFSVREAGDLSGAFAGFAVQRASYPQIDDPQTPAAALWNNHVQPEFPVGPAGDCPDEDRSTRFDIGLVSDRLVSLSWRFSSYCHGSAHPVWSFAGDTFVLSAAPHELEKTEAFDAAAQETLGGLLLAAARAQGWTPVEGSEQEVEAQIRAAAGVSRKWFFTRDGLEVRFDDDDGGQYGRAPQPVTIRWADLKPLLAPGAAVP